MTTFTIPKKLTQHGDLVVLPREQYEELAMLAKTGEFSPTKAQKRALAKAESNLNKGKTLSYGDVARKLGFAN